jgi:hypothetical protein
MHEQRDRGRVGRHECSACKPLIAGAGLQNGRNPRTPRIGEEQPLSIPLPRAGQGRKRDVEDHPRAQCAVRRCAVFVSYRHACALVFISGPTVAWLARVAAAAGEDGHGLARRQERHQTGRRAAGAGDPRRSRYTLCSAERGEQERVSVTPAGVRIAAFQRLLGMRQKCVSAWKNRGFPRFERCPFNN